MNPGEWLYLIGKICFKQFQYIYLYDSVIRKGYYMAIPTDSFKGIVHITQYN